MNCGLKKLSMEGVIEISEKYRISLINMVRILYEYTATNRLAIALPLLEEAWGRRKFKHRELAELVGMSREKITLATLAMKKGGK
ncbi:MAG: hypothetical protein V4550_18330 [Gemmatimonadota bacterium]